MPRKKKETDVKTRGQGEAKFGGLPGPLDLTEPPTNRQLIQYMYFLQNCGKEENEVISKVVEDVRSIWESVNPDLSIFTKLHTTVKVKQLFTDVKHMNWSKIKASRAKKITQDLDIRGM